MPTDFISRYRSAIIRSANAIASSIDQASRCAAWIDFASARIPAVPTL
jgi:hypothetical protein